MEGEKGAQRVKTGEGNKDGEDRRNSIESRRAWADKWPPLWALGWGVAHLKQGYLTWSGCAVFSIILFQKHLPDFCQCHQPSHMETLNINVGQTLGCQ